MASPAEIPAVQRSSSRSSLSVRKEKASNEDPENIVVISQDDDADKPPQTKYRPFILGALALLILGWWISATVLRATRHRW